jgi:hypothetical protein
MPLRQTRGVLASFKNLLTIPHYSTFARRGAGLVVPQISRGSGIGPLHLAAVTMTGEILAHDLTPSERHDGPELPGLLGAVEEPIEAASADGAYGAFRNHAAVLARKARPVIPPRSARRAGGKPPTRSGAVHRIAEVGRKVWKTATGYHKRSLSETAMLRFKTIIGANPKPRTLANQKTETSVAVRCLNSVTALGMPVSIKSPEPQRKGASQTNDPLCNKASKVI